VGKYRIVITIASDQSRTYDIERRGFFGWMNIERREGNRTYEDYDEVLERMKKYKGLLK